MTSEEFQKIISNIPTQPGIYKYYNANNILLYVGKAKNLRKRVSSYFTKTFIGYKTHKLVTSIHHIDFTIVDTEQDAFLLENALIKQFKPKYNILLKDDKTYPYIVIKNEPFARVFFTRKKINDGSEYFGPYTSVGKVKELLDFIKQYIPLRTCKLLLTTTNIQRKKFKLCLEYHLGNCKAPCEGLQTLDEYNEWLQQVRNILKGNISPVLQHLKKEMALKAANMEYEQAAIIKHKIDDLKKYQAKSVIVGKHLSNIDVFSILREKESAYVNYLMVQNGTIVQTHTIQLTIPLEQSDEEVLSYAIARLREDFNSISTEIIVPFKIAYPDLLLSIIVPKAGDKKQLLDLSLKNVNYFKQALQKKKILHLEGKTNAEKKKVLYELQQFLSLQELPVHIECFDNSNFQGSYPVSAMVCFKEGIPYKNEYRKFNVKTVQGINDFATMKEVVYRRYKRLLDEEKDLPQLIIIDGGKGQLSAAMESITTLALNNRITVVGLAKNEEQIFFHKDTEPITLPWNSNSLKLIRFIRDEVHRFGITFHRNKRSKGTFKNELENIKGIGKQTVLQLLHTFKSVKNIRSKSVEELAAIIGINRATIIANYLKED
ncbi:MAG: excinuclease ABC subunit UvrC [Chitinophagaceae bacterium]|nr:excinuclease ABC subunit UvrC [Chitinophagaceae bacterium]MCW5905749.1 excinuclease ABC subunit UvrC [Chitinophagaceae bacterium]